MMWTITKDNYKNKKSNSNLERGKKNKKNIKNWDSTTNTGKINGEMCENKYFNLQENVSFVATVHFKLVLLTTTSSHSEVIDIIS